MPTRTRADAEALVNRLYREYFGEGRPGGNEAAGWYAHAEAGMSERELRDNFRHSTEYRNRVRTQLATEHQSIYRTALVDPELNFWADAVINETYTIEQLRRIWQSDALSGVDTREPGDVDDDTTDNNSPVNDIITTTGLGTILPTTRTGEIDYIKTALYVGGGLFGLFIISKVTSGR